MNERYLFRGKRIDGFKKTWVTGHYVSVPRPMIVATKTRIGGGWDADDIDPATLGQCTGLLDKNGALVYEGDVIEYEIHKELTVTGKIVWNVQDAKFICATHDGSEWHFDETEQNEINVIGNIHDNPELLHQQP